MMQLGVINFMDNISNMKIDSGVSRRLVRNHINYGEEFSSNL
jgi:hypothetical protein